MVYLNDSTTRNKHCKKIFRPAFVIEMEYSNMNTVIIVIVELRPLYIEADVTNI